MGFNFALREKRRRTKNFRDMNLRLRRIVPLILFSLVSAWTALAQCPKDRPALQTLRYDEDWSLLEDSSCAKEPLDHIKYISLGRQDWFLSIGGEIRYKYENYDNPGFGTDPETPNGYILQRYLLHSDWHFGRHFRLFTQFQSGLEEGRNGGSRLTDKDVADLHQAFFDVTDASQNLRLRVGRQEIEFGSGHIIGESEGLNIRRAFDGFRFTYKHGRWTWNSTLTHPVLLRPDAYAIPNHQQTEWGAGFIRATERGGWGSYYIALNRKIGSFNGKVGQEVRHTLGTRIWDKKSIFDYDADFIFQTGTFATGNIYAGAISTNDGLTLRRLKFQPRFGVRFDYATGDSSRTSGNLNTFNPLFPNPTYSSLSALLGPSNVIDLGPTIRFALNSKTSLGLESPFYWRSSLQDGIYGFAGNLIRPANRSTARFIGVQPGITVDRSYTSHLSSSVAYFRFFTEDFLIQTPPGRNVGYLYAIVTVRY